MSPAERRQMIAQIVAGLASNPALGATFVHSESLPMRMVCFAIAAVNEIEKFTPEAQP